MRGGGDAVGGEGATGTAGVGGALRPALIFACNFASAGEGHEAGPAVLGGGGGAGRVVLGITFGNVGVGNNPAKGGRDGGGGAGLTV